MVFEVIDNAIDEVHGRLPATASTWSWPPDGMRDNSVSVSDDGPRRAGGHPPRVRATVPPLESWPSPSSTPAVSSTTTLQSLGRPARCRRLGGQRFVGDWLEPRDSWRDGKALVSGCTTGAIPEAAIEGHFGHRVSAPGSRVQVPTPIAQIFSVLEFHFDDAVSEVARAVVPQSRRPRPADRRAQRQRRRSFKYEGGISEFRRAPESLPRPPCIPNRSISKAMSAIWTVTGAGDGGNRSPVDRRLSRKNLLLHQHDQQP